MRAKPLFMLAIIALFFSNRGSGQDTLKATSHGFMTELNVNLFQGQISLNNALNQIKLRYMVSDGYALRLGFTTESRHVVDNMASVYGTNPSKNNSSGNSNTVGLNFGFEKHFAGTKRLSPYIGGTITTGYKWAKYETETNTLKTTIKGAWYQTQYVQNSNGTYYTTTTNIERGYFSYGLSLVTGFDFYLAKHLYTGYEMEFGFANKKYSNIDVTYSGTDSSNRTPSPDYDDSEFSLGPKIINGIRIGYVF